MPATVRLYWNPARLTLAIREAYAASLKVAESDAANHSPSRRAGVQLRGNALAPTDLGAVFEEGRRGGYPIEPRNKLALRFPNGGFAAFATGGSMAPRPYIRPAAFRWANGGFQATARTVLASRGF